MSRRRLQSRSPQPCRTPCGFEALERRLPLAITYGGGAVLPAVHVQNIYLGADWADPAKQTLAYERAQLEKFSAFIVKSSYMTMLNNAGYGVGGGTSESGCVVPLNLDKTKVLDDAAIRLTLLGQISAAGSQVNGYPDSNTLYMVYLEPGLATKLWTYDSRTNVYGWHGALAGKTRAGDAVDVRYAVIAHPGSPNLPASSWPCSTDLDLMTLTASHELAEAATDPDVNYKKLGWYDQVIPAEIGDVLPRLTVKLGGFCVQSIVDKFNTPMRPAGYQTYVYYPPISLPKTPTVRQSLVARGAPVAAVPAASDVDVRVSQGRLVVRGLAAGSRFIRIAQDGEDPGLLDVTPAEGSTVNGSATAFQVPYAAISRGISIFVNGGLGVNSATTLWIDTGTATVSGDLSVTVFGDGNSVVAAAGTVAGVVAVKTGWGDDQVELSSLSVRGDTAVDTGTGSDSVVIRSSGMHAVSILERGADNSLTIDQATMSRLTIDQRGSVSAVLIDGLTVSGGASARQAAGRQLFNVHDSTIAGAFQIREGSTPGASTLMFVDDTFGSLSIQCANGGYAVQANGLDVRGDLSINLGNGNSDVGIFETVRVGGSTAITVGNGTSAVGIVGSPSPTETPRTSVFGRIGIVMGRGNTAVAMNNLSAKSLTVRTGSPSAFVGIGGPITVPVLKGDLYAFSGNTFFGGEVRLAGQVGVDSSPP